MITLSLLSFIVSLDATILVAAFPVSVHVRLLDIDLTHRNQEMAMELHGSAAETFWAGTSYLLTSAVFQPVIAAASHIFGARQLLSISVFLFTVGSIICAVAQDFIAMLVGRSIQGVGGGGIITMTQVIFSAMIPLRQRPKYFSLVLGSWSIGSIIGPVVGGALAEHGSWRGCFYINIPFCVIGLGATLRYVSSGTNSSLSFRQKFMEMDWLGAILFVGGTTALLIGISWGGTEHPWKSAATITPIILGSLSIALFLVWQIYSKSYSLFPMSIFHNASLAVAFFCAFVNGFIVSPSLSLWFYPMLTAVKLFTALYYVSFYQISIRTSSPTRAGTDLLPALCLLVPSSIIVSILTSHLGRYRWAIWIGWLITTVACNLLISFDVSTSKAVFAVTLATFGIGNGMLLSINVAVQSASHLKDRTMAACMYGFMRSLGMSVGVAVGLAFAPYV
jgi:MFS family permease